MPSRNTLLAVLFLGLAMTNLLPGSTEDPLANLSAEHPRLLVEPSTWSALRARRVRDAALSSAVRRIEFNAQALIGEAPVERRKIGRRLLSVSRTALQRILTLALAYRISEKPDERLLQRAEREMLAAAAFEDWNATHFLDTAEMTAALAIGYDWLHDALPAESRGTIRSAIVEKGLRLGLEPSLPHNRWHQRDNNWNQVCWSGLTLGALAIAEDEPALAAELLSLARTGIALGLRPYEPDGVYPEGPSYWAYGTTYQVLMIAALESALGTDWGLTDSPGFLPSAAAYVQATGPTGLMFNFADGREHASLQPALLWFARRVRDDGLLRTQQRFLTSLAALDSAAEAHRETSRFLPLVPLWWPEAGLNPSIAPTLPKNWMGRGVNPIAVFRSSWTDPGALYLAIKGGAAELNHAHMDAGSFVLDRDGVRWACDLGMQEYESLESRGVDLWNRSQDSQRWTIFRLGNRSHNTLMIDDRLHRVEGNASISHFSAEERSPRAVVDLTPVLTGQASTAQRGFRVVGERAVLVQDDLSGLAPGAKVRWTMATGAKVSVRGDRATLRSGGKIFNVQALSPNGAKFTITSCEPTPGSLDAPNPGKSLLTLQAEAPAGGSVRIAVLLGATGAAQVNEARELVPVSDWASP